MRSGSFGRGFTLVEMLMVIAIIAIVATLAVSKVSGLKEKTALEMSIANQKSVERGVEAFLVAEGRLDRLDALTYYGRFSDAAAKPGFVEERPMAYGSSARVYRGPEDDPAYRDEFNTGLMQPLVYSHLTSFMLSPTDVSTFANMLGLKYVMRHWNLAATGPADYIADDGTRPDDADYRSPNGSACIVSSLSSNRWVMAVNPMTDSGRDIYRAFGQRLVERADETWDFATATNRVYATGGPLVVFGLGDEASIIGNSKAGFDSAPTSAYPLKKHYTRYLLVFRLGSAGAGMSTLRTVEFAGVLDCIGNTVKAAEKTLSELGGK